MEKNKRFRNHFSIVFERLGAGFLAFVMIFLYEGAELLREIGTVIANLENMKEELLTILLAVLGIIVLFAIVVCLQIFRWAKTWITIQDQAIVIEVNTLKRKKNTIGIKNISNINLEQNLFEMLMGTCKVKMDTNSMSTADSTDVKIVLKKAQAEEFKVQILGMIAQSQRSKVYEEQSGLGKEADTENTQIYMESFIGEQMSGPGAGVEEMLTQGIFSLKLWSIPLLILSIIGVVGTISEAIQEGAAAEGIWGVLSSILLIGIFGASLLRDMIKGFIRYYGFRICRLGDRLHIRYGLLKKASYTIPVDKINAVRLVQSPQARIAGRYMAELVNVGLGDDTKEEQSFFLLYDKKDRIHNKIRELLPEFADELDNDISRQSSKVWFVWMWPALEYLAVIVAVMLILSEVMREEMLIVIAVIATITVFVMIYVVGNYFTRGYYVGENSLKLVDGNFGKRILIVKYPKIQYLKTSKSFLARYFHIQKGEIYLLASTKNRIHNVPYFPEEKVEIIREKLLR